MHNLISRAVRIGGAALSRVAKSAGGQPLVDLSVVKVIVSGDDKPGARP